MREKENKRNYFCEEPSCFWSQYQFLLFGESLSQVDHLHFQLHQKAFFPESSAIFCFFFFLWKWEIDLVGFVFFPFLSLLEMGSKKKKRGQKEEKEKKSKRFLKWSAWKFFVFSSWKKDVSCFILSFSFSVFVFFERCHLSSRPNNQLKQGKSCFGFEESKIRAPDLEICSFLWIILPLSLSLLLFVDGRRRILGWKGRRRWRRRGRRKKTKLACSLSYPLSRNNIRCEYIHNSSSSPSRTERKCVPKQSSFHLFLLLLFAVSSLFGLFALPFVGRFIRYKKMIVFSQLIFIPSLFLLWFGEEMWSYFLARICQGICSSVYWASATACLFHLLSKDQYPKGFSYLVAGFFFLFFFRICFWNCSWNCSVIFFFKFFTKTQGESIGFMIGPFFGGTLKEDSFLLVAVSSSLLLLPILYYVPMGETIIDPSLSWKDVVKITGESMLIPKCLLIYWTIFLASGFDFFFWIILWLKMWLRKKKNKINKKKLIFYSL